MRIEAVMWILLVGAAICGFFAMVISPWWLAGFVWFLAIGYWNARDE